MKTEHIIRLTTERTEEGFFGELTISNKNTWNFALYDKSDIRILHLKKEKIPINHICTMLGNMAKIFLDLEDVCLTEKNILRASHNHPLEATPPNTDNPK